MVIMSCIECVYVCLSVCDACSNESGQETLDVGESGPGESDQTAVQHTQGQGGRAERLHS